MNEPQMKDRTKQLALRVLKMADALPTNRSGNAIASQIVRSSTSVAANYRALCRAESRADFINKTSIVEEEADESSFWLELIVDAGLLDTKRIKPASGRGRRVNGDPGRQSKDRYRSRALIHSKFEIRKSKIV